MKKKSRYRGPVFPSCLVSPVRPHALGIGLAVLHLGGGHDLGAQLAFTISAFFTSQFPVLALRIQPTKA